MASGAGGGTYVEVQGLAGGVQFEYGAQLLCKEGLDGSLEKLDECVERLDGCCAKAAADKVNCG